MLLIVYNIFFTLLIPILIINLFRKSKKNQKYKHHIKERLSLKIPNVKSPIWIHAVSVGENIAISPLVQSLTLEYPNDDILITMMTPTGRDEVKKLYKSNQNIYWSYLPYDSSLLLNNFINKIKPKILILMETEIWPILINTCYKNKIPIILNNARLSNKSKSNYQKILPISKNIMNKISYFSCQSQHDANNFIALGTEKNKVSITGNIKFDMELSNSKIELGKHFKKLFCNKKIWIASSTHSGEDEIILRAHKIISKVIDNSILIIVPRHPERFEEVYNQALTFKFQTIRRTELTVDNYNDQDVIIGNSMGEMMSYYYASHIAFVGGSLVKNGGHNILEPALLKLPIVSGPSLYNFKETMELFITADAISIVHDSNSLAKSIINLFKNPIKFKKMTAAASAILKQHRGALERQKNIIKYNLNQVKDK